MERGVTVESVVGSDGTTEMEGLKMRVVDPAARATRDNREVEGKSNTTQR